MLSSQYVTSSHHTVRLLEYGSAKRRLDAAVKTERPATRLSTPSALSASTCECNIEPRSDSWSFHGPRKALQFIPFRGARCDEELRHARQSSAPP
jgi:hypothetical protein